MEPAAPGAFYFVTAESSRKGRNLAADPRCVVAASSTTLPRSTSSATP